MIINVQEIAIYFTIGCWFLSFITAVFQYLLLLNSKKYKLHRYENRFLN